MSRSGLLPRDRWPIAARRHSSSAAGVAFPLPGVFRVSWEGRPGPSATRMQCQKHTVETMHAIARLTLGFGTR